MTTIYSPPERLTDYVAYESAPVATPDESGQPVQFRPQVYVREVPSVLVTGAKTSRMVGADGAEFATTSFTFDAASVGVPGFTNDFRASLRESDPLHDLLMQAHDRKLPVMVVIETVRKRRDSSGTVIDPRMPIHQLRGAGKDGRRADPAATRSNCKNVIVGAAAAGRPELFAVTAELTSVPSEWAALRANNEGQFAPAGWRVVDGGVEAAVAGRPRRVAVDLAGKQRAVVSYAIRKLTAVGAVEHLVKDSSRLAEVLLWCADQTHHRVFGTAGPVREETSHAESLQWVQLVLDQYSIADDACQFVPSLMLDDQRDQFKAWAEQVVAVAADFQRTALSSVEAHLAGTGSVFDDEPSRPLSPVPPAGGDEVLDEWADFARRVVSWADEHADRFHPWLRDTFGTTELTAIDPAALRAAISRYDQSVAARREFYDAVVAAHRATAPDANARRAS